MEGKLTFVSVTGAGDLTEGNCRQAPSVAWPTLLAQQLGIPTSSFTLAACSGFTSTDVLNNELGSVSPSTSLITITVGGNDIGVEPALAACVAPDNPLSSGPSNCQTAVMQSMQNTTQLGGMLPTTVLLMHTSWRTFLLLCACEAVIIRQHRERTCMYVSVMFCQYGLSTVLNYESKFSNANGCI